MSCYVTFYSYKGGVGRTLALVNTAVCLLKKGHSVLIWELDLEAPGLLNIPFFAPLKNEAKGGTINLLSRPPVADWGQAVSKYVLEHPEYPGRLRVLPAGPVGEGYAKLYGSIRWDELFGQESPNGSILFERIRQGVDTYNADFVLIDSRTGFSDTGAICTIQLPDIVVLVYHLSHQNQEGARQVQLVLDRPKAVRNVPLKVIRVGSMVPADKPDEAALRRKSAESANLVPHVEIPFNASLLLEEKIWAHEYPGDEKLTRYYEKLAGLITEAAPALAATDTRPGWVREREDDQLTRGRAFEDKVAEVLRLMGFEVETNVRLHGRETDFIAVKKEPLHETHFVGECKATRLPAGVEQIDALHSRLVSYGKHAEGLLVSEAGFTPDAKTHAPTVNVKLKTYAELLDGLLDIGPAYLNSLIQDYEGKDIEHLYVEHDLVPESTGQPEELSTYIGQWLADPETTCLTLLGDYGTGKTWFTRRLACELAKRFREDSSGNRYPVRIDLRDVAKALSLETLLIEHFRQSGRQVNAKAMLYLMAEGRFVFLFDGFDEMATQASREETLGNFRELLRATDGKAKVVITSRTHYFNDQDEVHRLMEQGAGALSSEGTELYKLLKERRGAGVAFVSDFTRPQVAEFVAKAAGARAPEVMEVVDRLPGLKEIATRPVWLDMIVKTVPELSKSDRPIKVANLYEAYTEEWMRRQDWRLRLTRDGRRTLVQELAARLWETDGARLHYRELANVLAVLVKDRITTDRDLEIADTEVRAASFLTRDAKGNYGFSHRSFLEFFVAQRTARLAREGKPVEALVARQFTPPVIALLCDLMESERDLLLSTAQRVLEGTFPAGARENALLVGHKLGGTLEGARLEEVRLAGLSLVGCRLRKANLEGANLAGCDLTQVDLTAANLQRANLAGANLTKAICTSASLREASLVGATCEGANLTGSNLTGADLSFAELNRCHLEGASWAGAIVEGTGFLNAKISPGTEKLWKAGLAPGTVRPGRIETPVFVLPPPAARARSVAWRPGGKLLAVASGPMILVYDAATGRCRRILEGHSHGVSSVSWSPDGGQLASGSDDNTVRVWDAASGRLARTLEGHSNGVMSVSWSPDGGQLASGSDDKTVRVWDAASGELLRTLYHLSEGGWLAIEPDGRYRANAAGKRSVHYASGWALYGAEAFPELDITEERDA